MVLYFGWGALLYCILLYYGRVPATNAPGCTAVEGLLYKRWSLVVPICTARCLSRHNDARDPSKKWPTNLAESSDFHALFRDLLHALNLRHGTKGFTSPPKEGVLRIFFALKNPMASVGFEPANLGTKSQHATSRPPKPLRHGVSKYFHTGA